MSVKRLSKSWEEFVAKTVSIRNSTISLATVWHAHNSSTLAKHPSARRDGLMALPRHCLPEAGEINLLDLFFDLLPQEFSPPFERSERACADHAAGHMRSDLTPQRAIQFTVGQ